VIDYERIAWVHSPVICSIVIQKKSLCPAFDEAPATHPISRIAFGVMAPETSSGAVDVQGCKMERRAAKMAISPEQAPLKSENELRMLPLLRSSPLRYPNITGKSTKLTVPAGSISPDRSTFLPRYRLEVSLSTGILPDIAYTLAALRSGF